MDDVAKAKLDEQTLIFDRPRNQQVMWLDGVVILPVGSVIQLGNPNRDAVVTGIRLWAASTATVILDCEVSEPLGGPVAKPREPLLRLV